MGRGRKGNLVSSKRQMRAATKGHWGRYAETTYRNNPITVLFVSPMGEDGQQKTDEEIPIWGALLQEEIERIGPLDLVEGHLYCRLGREKTTKIKKKCRIAQLFVAEKT